MLKRRYLNATEKNFYLVAEAFIQMINGQRNFDNKVSDTVWEEWKKHGMITPSMQKDLKLTKTYLFKFCDELRSYLDKEQLYKLDKQLMNFDYRIVDDYSFQKLLRDINDHYQYVVMKRDAFVDILEDVAQVRCVNCQKDYKSCPLYKALDDIGTPYCGEEPNCPYAANLELSRRDRKDIKKIEEKVKK